MFERELTVQVSNLLYIENNSESPNRTYSESVRAVETGLLSIPEVLPPCEVAAPGETVIVATFTGSPVVVVDKVT